MEPRIQYARTADGIHIAFWSLGEGIPLVCLPPMPFSHVRLEWQIPEYRRWYERLGRGRQLVRYDGRGVGLSERSAGDFSLEAQLRDLEAVVGSLGLGSFALLAPGDSGVTALAYAARNPERVSHLLLWCTWARRSDVSSSPRTQALRALLDDEWESYTDTVARFFVGPEAAGDARRFAEFYRQCASPAVLRMIADAVRGIDVTDCLPNVRCPALVLHRRDVPLPSMDVVTDLAARLPDARLVVFEGASPLPFMGDDRAVLATIGEFLGDGEPWEEETEVTETAALATVLFTDMEDSTGLTQRLGDRKAQDLVRLHNAIVRDALRSCGGHEIKHTGDGIMGSFPSASAALTCAITIQRGIRERSTPALESTAQPEGFRVRIGLNAGEPLAEEEDLFGTAVQVARRICDRAAAGEILASDVVRQLVAGKGFLFSDRGECVLRGFEDPVRLFEVRWRESSVAAGREPAG